MITGAKGWSNMELVHSQENNPTEAFQKATLTERAEWLESCGPTSAVNCLEAMGFKVAVVCPGKFEPQPEEVLMDYFNDPRNRDKLKAIRNVADIPGNRVPQYYPEAVLDVFGVRAEFRWLPSYDAVCKLVSGGQAVQVCLEKPGHYIALVAYDSDTRELIYHDSWGSRFKDGAGGYARRMGVVEFTSNVKNYCIVYGV